MTEDNRLDNVQNNIIEKAPQEIQILVQALIAEVKHAEIGTPPIA